MVSQSSIAYQQLKNMIFHLELLPGARISEPQISAKLSISRTPVRDALRRLESEGLVVIDANKGAAVTSFSSEQIKEIGEIRLAHDILCAQLAAYYGSAADFDNLTVLADKCEEAAKKGDIYERIQTDANFHLEIARISRNTQLLNQQYTLYQQIHLIQISKYQDIKHSLFEIQHHKPIIEAIRNGDLQQIRFLICEHIKEFYMLDTYIMNCYREE